MTWYRCWCCQHALGSVKKQHCFGKGEERALLTKICWSLLSIPRFLKLSFMLSLPLPPIANLMHDYEVCSCSQGYWAAEPQQKVLGGRRHTSVKWWRLGQLPDMELGVLERIMHIRQKQ